MRERTGVVKESSVLVMAENAVSFQLAGMSYADRLYQTREQFESTIRRLVTSTSDGCLLQLRNVGPRGLEELRKKYGQRAVPTAPACRPEDV